MKLSIQLISVIIAMMLSIDNIVTSTMASTTTTTSVRSAAATTSIPITKSTTTTTTTTTTNSSSSYSHSPTVSPTYVPSKRRNTSSIVRNLQTTFESPTTKQQPQDSSSTIIMIGPTCTMQELVGKTYKVPFTVTTTQGTNKHLCVKVELFQNGIFSVDSTNAGCFNDNFVDESIYSFYDTSIGNKVMFKQGSSGTSGSSSSNNNNMGWTGYFTVKEDSSITEIQFHVTHWWEVFKRFSIDIIFPSCTTTTTTMIPSSAPIISSSTTTDSCQDDEQYRIKTDKGKNRSCDWLKDNYIRQHKYCKRSACGYPTIGHACPKSCHQCPSE